MSKAGQRYLQEHQDEVEEAIALATAPLIEALEGLLSAYRGLAAIGEARAAVMNKAEAAALAALKAARGQS